MIRTVNHIISKTTGLQRQAVPAGSRLAAARTATRHFPPARPFSSTAPSPAAPEPHGQKSSDMPFAIPQTISGALGSLKSTLGLGPSTADNATSTTDQAPILSPDVLFELMRQRHSYYVLTEAGRVTADPAKGETGLAVDRERVRKIVEDALILTPSSFNSQPSRVVLLFGDEHDRFWDMTRGALRDVVPDDKWAGTETKMKQFRAAAGTILFFTDVDVVSTMERKVPPYADRFMQWATQSDGMLQLAIWVALSNLEGLGANLQHYNPLVDDRAREAWKLPENWKLTAQLVFGVRDEGQKGLKEQVPLEKRMLVFGA